MSEAESQRASQLLCAIDLVITEHDRWVQSEDPYISNALGRALDDLCALWGSGSIPADCRRCFDEVAEMMRLWAEYQEVADAGGSKVEPPRKFWQALSGMRHSREQARPRTFARPESVTQLIEQHVPRHQICKIWGFIRDDGHPDYERLNEEIAEPGKHTGPDSGWINPLELRWRREQQRDQEAMDRVQRRQQEAAQRVQTPPAAAVEVADDPEEMEDLAGDAGTLTDQVLKLSGDGLSVRDIQKTLGGRHAITQAQIQEILAGGATA